MSSYRLLLLLADNVIVPEEKFMSIRWNPVSHSHACDQRRSQLIVFLLPHHRLFPSSIIIVSRILQPVQPEFIGSDVALRYGTYLRRRTAAVIVIVIGGVGVGCMCLFLCILSPPANTNTPTRFTNLVQGQRWRQNDTYVGTL